MAGRLFKNLAILFLAGIKKQLHFHSTNELCKSFSKLPMYKFTTAKKCETCMPKPHVFLSNLF